MSDGFQVCGLSDEIADGEWLANFEVRTLPSEDLLARLPDRLLGADIGARGVPDVRGTMSRPDGYRAPGVLCVVDVAEQWVVALTAAIAS
jgi:hypothetical protein